MELKHQQAMYNTLELQVLIEPLWNWNNKTFDKMNKFVRINRTFMELKRSCSKINIAGQMY